MTAILYSQDLTFFRHAADGSGYKLLVDFVIELNPVNPQIASRLVQAMIRWHRFNETRQNYMRKQLQKILATKSCSQNTYEVITRALD